MSGITEGHRPAAGDVVEVSEHRVGDTPRLGELLEVIGKPGHEHYRVRWADGIESILYPSSDTVIRQRRPTPGSKTTH